MCDLKLEIKDYYELLNLHKALLEAKFHQNPDNKYVAGSPFIAKICNDIIFLLAEYDIKRKGEEGWTSWRMLCNHEYYKKRAIEAIIRFGGWEKFTFDEKRDRVFNYISPFTCTKNEIIDLIYEIDEIILRE